MAQSSETCAICFDAPADCLIAPCGHQCGCVACLEQLQAASREGALCPICRAGIQSIIKVIPSGIPAEEDDGPAIVTTAPPAAAAAPAPFILPKGHHSHGPLSRLFVKPDERKLDRGQVLGAGAFGAVFVGEVRRVRVAVKRCSLIQLAQGFTKTFDADAVARARELVEREASIMLELDHQCVLEMCGIWYDDEYAYVATELCENGSMETYLRDHEVPLAVRLRMLADVASGMAYLHANKDIIHRDLKPGNVLLTKDLVVKICDFGFARHAGSVTGKTAQRGTPRFYASGILFPDPKDQDVYSYGIMAYEVISKKMAFADLKARGYRQYDLIDQIHRSGARPNPMEMVGISQELQILFERCWTPRTQPSFKEIARSLQLYLRGGSAAMLESGGGRLQLPLYPVQSQRRGGFLPRPPGAAVGASMPMSRTQFPFSMAGSAPGGSFRPSSSPSSSSLLRLQKWSGKFKLIWNDRRSGGYKDGSFWAPVVPVGWAAVGHLGLSTYKDPSGSKESIVIAQEKAPANGGLAPPVHFVCVWTDKGTGSKMDGSVWRPVPPSGYVSMGDVFVRGYRAPPANYVMCVCRSEVEIRAGSASLVWKDRGTRAKKDMSIFRVEETGCMVAIPGYPDVCPDPSFVFSSLDPRTKGTTTLLTYKKSFTLFEMAWSDKGSGAYRDATFWTPVLPTGWSAIGTVGVGHYRNPAGCHSVTIVKEKIPGNGGLAPPVRFELIWNDKGTNAKFIGSVWRPIAPVGYVTMGHVFVPGHSQPSPGAVVCVKASEVEVCRAGISSLIWNDRGSGAGSDLSVFEVKKTGVVVATLGYPKSCPEVCFAFQTDAPSAPSIPGSAVDGADWM